MKYVIDASVGFKWAVVEQHTDKARQLRDEYIRGAHELLAPDVFPIEVSHGLTRAERQRRITPAEGAQFLTDLLRMLPLMHASLPLLPRAYEISSQIRIGVYDCLNVALAEREKCQLITADDRLVKNLSTPFPFILSISSLP
jgi:predicted nucleic acid-binding protein